MSSAPNLPNLRVIRFPITSLNCAPCAGACGTIMIFNDSGDDDAPTPKESGSLAIFETTCNEAVDKLAGDDSEIADALRHEARQLLSEIASWKTHPPDVTVRANVVARVMDLHRAAFECFAKRSTLPPAV